MRRGTAGAWCVVLVALSCVLVREGRAGDALRERVGAGGAPTAPASAAPSPAPSALTTGAPGGQGRAPPASLTGAGAAPISGSLRTRCACAPARWLREGKDADLGGTRSLAAWLDPAAALRLEPDTAALPPGGALPTLRSEPFVPPIASPNEPVAVPSRTRLVRVFADPPGPGAYYLGIWHPQRSRPSDVVRVQLRETSSRADTPAGDAAGVPARIGALHLSDVREEAGGPCGPRTTVRALFQPLPGEVPPAAFWATFLPEDGAPRQALLDERHVRNFGLGYVAPCEHGLPLDPAASGTLVLRPVARSFALGEPWTWSLREGVLAPTLVPAHAAPDMLENPFVSGYRTPLERILGNDRDEALLGFYGVIALAVVGLAWLLHGALRRRGPLWCDVACPACGAAMRLNLRDPASDGCFCPACGGAAVFISFAADGAPRAHALPVAAQRASPVALPTSPHSTAANEP